MLINWPLSLDPMADSGPLFFEAHVSSALRLTRHIWQQRYSLSAWLLAGAGVAIIIQAIGY